MFRGRGKMKEKKRKKDTKVEDLTDTLKRLQAEFENYKKRTENGCNLSIKYANADLIAKLLPVVDNFELAINNNDGGDFSKGIVLIYDELMKVLSDFGLKQIETKDTAFDPRLHEAVMTEENVDFKKNMIIQELQKGYMLNEKIIRHSKVKVAK